MNRDISTDFTAGAANILRHLNSRHPDTVLFLARHSAGIADALAAELVGADYEGIDMSVKRALGSSTGRLQFGQPITAAAELRPQLRGLLIAARAAAPQEPLTSLEEEMSTSRANHHDPGPR